VLHVPHGARRVPDAVRAGIVLDDAELAAELDRMTDTHTGLIARQAAQAAASAPWIFENPVSRLVVDPERFPDEREEMRAVGMGAVYTKTSQGTPLRRSDPEAEQALLDEYFTPYALAMAQLVDDRLAATGCAVILDVHSYPGKPLPYELYADGTRPAVCLGTDSFHTPGWLLDAARAAFEPCGDVALDTPFAGCYVPLRHYGSNASVAALMIEIRRDTYLTEPAGPPTPGLDRLAAALARLVDRVDSRLSPTEHS
jgi:N-formylglutamate deformylase